MLKKIFAALSIMSLVLLYLPENEINSFESVIIDEGTDYEYEVGADDLTVEEQVDSMYNDYVQGSSYTPSFKNNILESLSHYSGLEIHKVFARDDGDFTIVISSTNQNSYYYNASQNIDVYRDNYVFLLIVDIDGAVKKSLNITDENLFLYDGTGAFKNTLNVDSFFAYNPIAFETSSGYAIAYQGVKFDDQDKISSKNLFKIDFNLTSNASVVDLAASEADYNNQVNTNRLINIYEYSEDNGFTNDSLVGLGAGNSDDNFSYTPRYLVQFVDAINNVEVGSLIDFYVPLWENVFDDTTSNYSYYSRDIEFISKIPTSTNYFGKVNYVGIDRSGTRKIKSYFLAWNSSGNTIRSFSLGENSFVKIQPNISTSREFYFIHNDKLKMIDLLSGEFNGDILTLPVNDDYSDIEIVKASNSLYSNSDIFYEFYGYIPSASGIFDDYGTSGGAVFGTMKSDFSIVSANIFETTPKVSFNVKKFGSSYFTYGTLFSNTNFTLEPVTNSIDDIGWIDKADIYLTSKDDFDSYFGNGTLSYDFAPLIFVADSFTINKDDYSSDELLKKAVLDNVKVYDSYDNINDLEARINVNPNNTSASIDWESLGLNYNGVGPNRVKFFVSDSKQQASVTSSYVNIVDNNTSISKNNEYFLNASSFTILLSDAKDLSLQAVRQLDYANVKLWQANSLSIIDSGLVGVEQTQLNAIQNATEQGVYELTFYYDFDDGLVTNTVSVYVTNNHLYDSMSKDYAVVANDFMINIDNVASLTNESMIDKSNASAYNVLTNEKLETSFISSNFNDVNSVSDVGIFFAKFVCEKSVCATTSNVFVVDENTVTNSDSLLAANSFITNVDSVSEALSSNSLNEFIYKNSNVIFQTVEGFEIINFGVNDITYSEEIVPSKGTYEVVLTNEELSQDFEVYVVDNSTNSKHSIGSNNVFLTVDQVNSFTASDYIEYMGAVAIDGVSHTSVDPSEISVDFSNVKNLYGSYQVVFNYDGVSVISNVNVFDSISTSLPTLAANNIYVSVSDVDNLTKLDYLKKSNFSLKDSFNLYLNYDLVDVDSSRVLDDVGVYSVSYSYMGSFVNANVIVVENLAESNHSTMYGNNFSIHINDVDYYKNNSKELLLLGDVTLLTTNSTNKISSVDASFLNSSYGTYPIYVYDKFGTKLTIYVVVGENLVTSNHTSVSAKDVIYTTDEMISFSGSRQKFNEDLIARSMARAWRTLTNENVGVYVNSNSIPVGNKTVRDFEEYTDRDFYMKSLNVDKQTKEQLSSRNTAVNLQSNYVIGADAFGISSSDVGSYNAEKYLEKSGAFAYSIEDDMLVDAEITDVDFSKVLAKEGFYPVTFSVVLDKETLVETSINVYVGKNRVPEIIDSSDVVIYASDYTITEKESDLFTTIEHLKKADVYIIDMNTGEKIEMIFSDLSNITNKPGVYAGYFGASSTLVSAVSVTVVSDKDVNYMLILIISLTILLVFALSVIRYVYKKNRAV